MSEADNYTQQMGVRVDEATKARLKQVSRKLGISTSAVIRLAIKTFLESWGRQEAENISQPIQQDSRNGS